MAALLDLSAAAFAPAIADHFAGQAETVRDAAVRSFEMGFEYAKTRLVATHAWRALTAPAGKPAVELVTGAAAIAAACAAAGVGLAAFYPVTPADWIRAALERLPADGRPVSVLAADAAGAAAHAYGAVAAGRSAVAVTAGSSLAAAGPLLDQAAAAGLPLVVVHVQTAGPTAALGTSTGQGDLLAAIHGLSDVQRPVLAPACTEDCFDAVCLAVRLAARWRTPAVVLTDFLQLERGETVGWPRPLPAAAAALAAATPAPTEAWAPPGTPGGERLVPAGGPDKRSGATEAVASCPIAVGLHRGRLNALAAGWTPPETFGDDGPLDLGLVAWAPPSNRRGRRSGPPPTAASAWAAASPDWSGRCSSGTGGVREALPGAGRGGTQRLGPVGGAAGACPGPAVGAPGAGGRGAAHGIGAPGRHRGGHAACRREGETP